MVAATLIAMCWLATSQPVMAAQREVQSLHSMAAAELKPEPKPGLKLDDGPLRPYGTDRTERLRRGRVAENVLVVAVGVAAAVAGVVIGGLAFAIAAGAAGVYVVLALP